MAIIYHREKPSLLLKLESLDLPESPRFSENGEVPWRVPPPPPTTEQHRVIYSLIESGG